MAKQLRFTEADELALLSPQAEFKALKKLHQEFSNQLVLRFKQIKDNVEDWDDAITNEALLKTRLQNIVANVTYTENNLKDIALIAMFLWNIEEV